MGTTWLAELFILGAACWAAVLVHEGAHAAAAVSLGVRLWGVRLGVGPALWVGRIRGVRVRVGLLPLAGSVQLLDADAVRIGYRDIARGRWRFEWVPGAWRAPVISGAGAFANLAAAGSAVAWAAALPSGSGIELFAVYLALANLSGYLNLLPCFSSDGAHLLAHLAAIRRQLTLA